MFEFQGRYAALWLNELQHESCSRHYLLLPLIIAYYCSLKIRFRFPQPAAAVKLVDKAFDRIMQDMPAGSRGIGYEFDLSDYDFKQSLRNAEFILITDCMDSKYLASIQKPRIIIVRKDEGELTLEFRSWEKMKDPALRQDINRLVQEAIHNHSTIRFNSIRQKYIVGTIRKHPQLCSIL